MINNDLFPCLWYDGDAKESAEFYCQVFDGNVTVDSPMVINIELFGQRMMLLNGGPQFQKSASISFVVLCETEQEVEKYWSPLAKDGIVLMELGEYPWSKKYGWVRDRFGVAWQVYLGEKQGEQKLIPTLMFIHENNGKAKKAMELYTSIFPNSKIGNVLKYEDGIGNETHEIPENIQHADFEINGYTFFCMDNSYDHQFNFNEAISIVVMTDDQQETDHYWNHLISDGGEESRCGWLKDPFGVSWQIVPKRLLQLMNDFEHPSKAQKVIEAMLNMKKIIIADLEEAYKSV